MRMYTKYTDQERFQKVVDYVERVLKLQRDPYHDTPLFADAINVETGELFEWVNADDTTFTVSNLANQQNFMRLLVGLSVLTEEAKYKEAAVSATRYMLEHYMGPDHLLYWGGHTCVDLKTQKVVGPDNKAMVHELKNGLPYYDLMFEVDTKKTSEFIEAFWNAHIYNWEDLEVGRHGEHVTQPKDYPFNHEFVIKEPHRESIGLSFLNAGNDLIYAAGKYAQYNEDEKAYQWSEYLARQYVEARDPKTRLGAYQFTQKIQSIDPIASHIPDSDTNSIYGDRAKRQFGHQYPNVLETRMLLGGRPLTIYATNSLMQLQLFLEIGKQAQNYKKWTLEATLAFIRYLYDSQDYTIKPMITDGTDLTGYTLEKDGYYGKKGNTLQKVAITPAYLLALVRMYQIAKEDEEIQDESRHLIWETVRSMAKGLGLGEIGEEDGRHVQVDLQSRNAEGTTLFAILELYQTTKREVFLDLARAIGNQIIDKCYTDGYFTLDKECVYSHIDQVEPLALVALEATLQGKYEQIPTFIDGKGYMDGNYKLPNGCVISTTTTKIYEVKR